MKRIFFFLLAGMMMMPMFAIAQAQSDSNDSIYSRAEEEPRFKDGQPDVLKYIAEHVVYPDSALAQGAQGKVYCEFVVEKDGSLSNIRVVRSSKNKWLDEEAVRVIGTMPQWHAGKIGGIPVRSRYFMPVIFKIQTPPVQPVEQSVDEEPDENIYVEVERMPEFPGGQQALFNYLNATVMYPIIARENGIQGTSIVQFVVNKDGSITDVEIYRSGGDPSIDKEAIRVIRSMPKWRPGMMNSKLVRVKYAVPVNFRLTDKKKK